jgi:SSS family solute:Na+ symporter
VWAAFMFIGSLLWAYYRVTGEHLPRSITKPDQVFPHFLVTHLPVGVTGLIVACLFGSAISMLASDINSLAAIGVEDYFRLLFPESTDRHGLYIGRCLVVASGIAAAAAAWLVAQEQGPALDLYFAVTASVAGGLAGLFLLAFLCPRAGRTAGLVGAVAGVAVTLWGLLTEASTRIVNLGSWNFPWHEDVLGAFSNLALFGAGLLFSLIAPAPQSAELTLWGWLRSAADTRGSGQKEFAGCLSADDVLQDVNSEPREARF